MLKLGKYKTGEAFYIDKYKKFRGTSGKIYKGNKVILLAIAKDNFIYVTLESFKKYKNKQRESMTVVEEITSWENKVDNLKISTRSGMYKRTWRSRKKSGTKHFTTGRNRGTVQAEKGQQGAQFVKKSTVRD